MHRMNRAPRGDSGAVAVMVALLTVVLFGTGALAVDLGNMYQKRRATQTTADLAALAGVQLLPERPRDACQEALAYLQKNLPSSQGLPPMSCGNNGDTVEQDQCFKAVDGARVSEPCIDVTGTRIRVIVPDRKVAIGLAGIVGITDIQVSAAATAEVRSPKLAMPFFAAQGLDHGYQCIKDSEGGGGGNASVLRAAFLPKPDPTVATVTPPSGSTAGGYPVDVKGNHFTGTTSVRVDGTAVTFTVVDNKNLTINVMPAHAAGAVPVVITNGSGSVTATFTYVAPGAPTVTAITPASGTAGTSVVITGTNFTASSTVAFGSTPATSVTYDAATGTLTAVAPAGSGTVDVRVTDAGGTSANTAADDFTYLVDDCEGTAGNFGFLDIPGYGLTSNKLIQVNVANGIDHGLKTWADTNGNGRVEDSELSLDAQGQCANNAGGQPTTGSVPDVQPGVPGANCVSVQQGNRMSDVFAGFLDGTNQPDYPARLAEPPGGHDRGSINGHGDGKLDLDSFTEYLAPGVTLNQVLAPNADTSALLSPDIFACPRFAIIPVLRLPTANVDGAGNGYYPIVGFRGIFVDSPAPQHGFVFGQSDGKPRSVKAYVFNLPGGVLDNSSEDGTVEFIGSGPKVPVLVE